jgi:LuxR family transcriptional regulator, quorum-sensing system regulator BjaR1
MIVGEDELWGRRALDFVDAANRLDSPAILRLFETQLAGCGFTSYMMAALPVPGVSLEALVVANGWPAGWTEIYVRENFSAVDPVVRYGASTVQPFEWWEARYDPEQDPAAHTVMTRATDFGLHAGFSIPLHHDGAGALVTMAGERPEFGPGAKSAMQLIAIFMHNRIRSLKKLATPERSPLSGREREILLWAAEGKTAWEISVILNIAERTVKFHLIGAGRKLNAANRTAAVAKALAMGLIQL